MSWQEMREEAERRYGHYVGKRIELVHTDDPYTKLKPGDKGTVTGVWAQDMSGWRGYKVDYLLNVKWDSGSNLSMVIGRDQVKIID